MTKAFLKFTQNIDNMRDCGISPLIHQNSVDHLMLEALTHHMYRHLSAPGDLPPTEHFPPSPTS